MNGYIITVLMPDGDGIVQIEGSVGWFRTEKAAVAHMNIMAESYDNRFETDNRFGSDGIERADESSVYEGPNISWINGEGEEVVTLVVAELHDSTEDWLPG